MFVTNVVFISFQFPQTCDIYNQIPNCTQICKWSRYTRPLSQSTSRSKTIDKYIHKSSLCTSPLLLRSGSRLYDLLVSLTQSMSRSQNRKKKVIEKIYDFLVCKSSPWHSCANLKCFFFNDSSHTVRCIEIEERESVKRKRFLL